MSHGLYTFSDDVTVSNRVTGVDRAHYDYDPLPERENAGEGMEVF